MKKKNLVLVASLLGLSLALGACGEGSSTKTEDTTAATTTEKAKPIKKDEAKEVKIGETAKAGKDLEVTVLDVSQMDSVSGDFSTAEPQGTYLAVKVKAKNIANSAKPVTGMQFKLIDGEMEYSTDSTAMIYGNNNQNSLFGTSINPGIELEGTLYFDVPSDLLEKDGVVLLAGDILFTNKNGTLFSIR